MRSISDFINDLDSGRGNITVHTSVYSLDAIHAAAYTFTGSYHVLITPNPDDTVTVIFESKRDVKDTIENLKNFANNLIDHQVRIQLDKTNGKIRDLIVKHAFSSIDLKKEIEAL